MSNVFKNSKAKSVGTSFTNLYTCPSGKLSSIITNFRISNLTASPITVNAQMKDYSDSNNTVALIGTDTAIAANGFLDVLPNGGRIVLETSDAIEVKSSAATSIDAHLGANEFA